MERRLRGAREDLRRHAQGERKDTGAGAVDASRLAKRMKGAPAASPSKKPEAERLGWGGGYAGNADKKKEMSQTKEKLDEMIRKVGSKTFYLSGGVWYDSKYKKDMNEVKVTYLSDEYFELLNKHEGAAKYFAIAAEVVVVIEGKAYRIVEE